MDTSEQINEIAGALAKAQSAMGHAVKDRTNPHMRNKYATLAAVIDAARPHLSAQGVCIVQSATLADDRVAVVTLLAHSSGQWLRATTCLPPTALSTKGATGLDAQSVGSTITYAKRYGLMAMLGISAEDEDDDGNAASGRRSDPPRSSEQRQSAPTTPPPAATAAPADWRAGAVQALKSRGLLADAVEAHGEPETWTEESRGHLRSMIQAAQAAQSK